jgi:transposase
VTDRRVVSEPLLEALDKEGMGYITGIPLKKWKAVERLLRRASCYHEVAENLRVNEVWDNGRRYVVCHNRERKSEDARRRTEIVAALEGMLAQVGLVGLARQNGYRRYLKMRDDGQAEVDWRRVKRDERYDGKFLLRSNTKLSAAEIGLAYKELWRVEYVFRELKTGLEIRPVRHWAPSRVGGHFGVCFLALVVESTLARMLREKNLQVNYRKVLKDRNKSKQCGWN